MLIRVLHPSFLSWDPWLFTVPIWVYFCTPCFEKNIGQSFSEPCECVSRKGSRSWEWVQRTSLGRQQRLTSTKSIRTAVKEQLRKWRNNVRVWTNTHTHTALDQGVGLQRSDSRFSGSRNPQRKESSVSHNSVYVSAGHVPTVTALLIYWSISVSS